MQAIIRKLDRLDIPAIMELEQVAWPADVRAPKLKFLDRLTTFGDGFLGAFNDERLIGMASSQVINHASEEPPKSWTELTADGWIGQTHRPKGDCLHFVSICVHPQARGKGIGAALNRARLDLARRLKLRRAITDARLPGLADYLRGNPETTAEQYIEGVAAGRLRETVVKMYLSLGFRIVGLVPRCMKSDRESAHYGLAMLKQLEEERS